MIKKINVFYALLSLNLLFITHCSYLMSLSPPPHFGVDFIDSMMHSGKFNPNILQTMPILQTIKQMYETYLATMEESHTQNPRIPKIIHQIWLGSPFPEKYKSLRGTWLKRHSDWQYILWTDEMVEQFGLVNKDLFDRTNNYGLKSDIARLEILNRIGGLYVDTDFECLQPLDWLHHTCEFYAGIGYGKPFKVFNSLLASRPGHPILSYAINEIQKHGDEIKPNPTLMDVVRLTGPIFLGNTLTDYLAGTQDHAGIVLLPISYFHPWPNWVRELNTREEIERWIRPESLGIHHWHATWDDKFSILGTFLPHSIRKQLKRFWQLLSHNEKQIVPIAERK